jgi:hypothetical protein
MGTNTQRLFFFLLFVWEDSGLFAFSLFSFDFDLDYCSKCV